MSTSASWNLVVDSSTTTTSNNTDAFDSTGIGGVDLELDVNGDLVIDTDIYLTKGINAVAQGIELRIKLFQGEWFADLDAGVPYWQDILGQKYEPIKIQAAFRDEILDAPGAEELVFLNSEFSGQTRLLNINWEVSTGLEGEEINGKINFEV